MKIRKLLALTVVFAMIAAFVPALGLTASAAVKKGDSVDVGNEIYIADSDDLIAGGDFESDDWEEVLTTGAMKDSSGGEPGVDAVIKMNSDPRMEQKGAVAFKRVEGRNGGQAISPAVYDLTPSGSIHHYTNDENGPTSIKHYIKNTSNTGKMYYVSFWAKSLSNAASLKYFVGAIDAVSAVASNTSLALNENEWSHVEAVVTVPANQYVLINVFNMGADAVALDDFSACEISRSAESESFTQAKNEFERTFTYETDRQQDLTGDLNLVRTVGRAAVTWELSTPEGYEDVIDLNTGKVGLVEKDVVVTLTATLTLGAMSKSYVYYFRVVGYQQRLEAAVTSDSFVQHLVKPGTSKITLPSSVPGFEGSMVSWTSENEDIIASNGTVVSMPQDITRVTLRANVLYNGEESVIPVVITVGKPLGTLVPNGNFEEALNGKVIPGWTNGKLTSLTTDHFDYMTEDNGNHYIVSKGHGDFNSEDSIKLYIDLKPGRLYRLSYKVWYKGTGSCEENYTAAGLVSDHGTDPGTVGFANIDRYGGIDYPGADWDGKYTSADGWDTIDVGILRPDDTYRTLLITAKWLNRNKSNSATSGSVNDSGYWAFDDFVLEEISSEYLADVTINYFDYETGNSLGSRVAKNQYGDLEYFANSDDKADKTVNVGNNTRTYRYYSEASTDSVVVGPDPEDNVINLYFRLLKPKFVKLRFIDYETGTKLADTQTITRNVYANFLYRVPDSYKSTVIGPDGKYYEYDSEHSEDTKMISENDADNVIVLYFKLTLDAVLNGDFNNGATGWTNRYGGDITGWSIYDDSEIGSKAFNLGNPGGKDSTQTIGTIWKVTPGKIYTLSFYLRIGKLEEKNYVYNRVSDAVGSTDKNTRDNAGNIIYEYGKEYAQKGIGAWHLMEKEFTAQTDTVYFQASWAEDYRIAQVSLMPLDESTLGSVQINYLDEDGYQIKEPSVVAGLHSGTWTLTDDYKEDFIQDGFVYKFRRASAKEVNVVEGQISYIDLTFEKIQAANVTLKFTDLDGNTLKSDVTGLVGAVGSPFAVPAEYRDTIVSDGKSYVFDSYEKTLIVNEDSEQNVLTLRFVAAENLISNGSFEEELDGENIPGWTVGNGATASVNDVQQMTTEKFSIENENGNHYLKSKGGQGLADTGSIKRYITNLEAGKRYSLNFKIRRFADITNNESWIEAILTDSNGTEIREDGANNHDEIVRLRETYGSIIPEKAAQGHGDMFIIGPSDGWYTVSTVLKPDSSHNTLLIGAKWLDTNWGFDDFSLVEMGRVMQGDVVLHYVDMEGNAIKDQTITGVEEGHYTLPAAYTGEITDDNGVVYRVNLEMSETDTDVIADYTNEMTLYCSPAPAAVTILDGTVSVRANGDVDGKVVVAQYAADGALVNAQTIPVNVNGGQTESVEFDNNYGEGAMIVKAFVIDSTDGLSPLAGTASMTVPGVVTEKVSFANIVASQEPEDTHTKDMAADGTRETAWTCQGNGDIVFDMGQINILRHVDVYLSTYADSRTLPIKVYVSRDNTDWTLIEDKTYSNPWESVINTSECARYIKVECNGNSISNWASLAEVEAYCLVAK